MVKRISFYHLQHMFQVIIRLPLLWLFVGAW